MPPARRNANEPSPALADLIDRILDVLAGIPPITWLERLIRGPVGPEK